MMKDARSAMEHGSTEKKKRGKEGSVPANSQKPYPRGFPVSLSNTNL